MSNLDKIKIGNDEAINEFYNNSYKSLYYNALKLVKNTEEAKDIVQYGYAKTFEHIEEIKDDEHLIKYIHTVVNNKCVDYLKKKKSLNFSDIVEEDGEVIDIEDTNEDFIPDKVVNEQALRDYISDELNKLPDDQRTCIMLRYFEDLSISEVAATLGCSESTVKSRINYGQKKLASSIDEYQKKNDIKLYNISAIPVLLYFMRKGAESVSVDNSNIKNIVKSIPTEATKEVAKKSILSKFFETTKNKVIAGIAAASIAVATPVAYQVIKKADPFDYIDVQFSGLNGSGTVTYQLNETEILEEFVGDEPATFEEMGNYFIKADAILSNINIEISKKENLTNGDEVIVSVTTEGEAAKEIKSSEKKFTVNGLKECEMVDAFKDLEVVFTGISGIGKANLKNNSSDEFIKGLKYTVDKEYNLSNSEKIIVTVSYRDYDAEKFGKMPNELSKEYTVNDLPEYVTYEKISNELVQKMSTHCLEALKKEREQEKYFAYKNIKIHSVFFQDRVTKSSFGSNVVLTIIVSEEMYKSDGEFLRVQYAPIKYSDIVCDDEGNPIIDLEAGNRYAVGNVESYINDMMSDTQYKTYRLE